MGESAISLATLGWSPAWAEHLAALQNPDLQPGRIAIEDKHHYVVFADQRTWLGQVTGKLLHSVPARSELPKVGDWVTFTPVQGDQEKCLIHHVLPRRTRLSRKVPGRQTEEQVLVTNVDIAFVVQALDRSFNLGLLQRHLAMVNAGGVKPVIVLNKADLCDDILDKLASVEKVAADTPVIAVSARTGRAIDSLTQLIRPGETVVFIGASGVGKSSLINTIYGEDIQATTEVRESDAKGRHTTTWRELIVLPNGGLVIDTPGMREFQMWMADELAQDAFPDVEEIALRCHFPNCTHTNEKRCAVLAAVESGELARQRYEQYIKLQRELAYLHEAARHREYLERKRRSQRDGRGKPFRRREH
ncbi:MAG TPA: ribosome small subunit-dependent GTPase A [Verrucomicrobia bacterium]|nr:ribosome small subunit-dependent GTPase A [Verrucomicrobiota bacterium]HOB33219.1 ribosome small subunit-dependent GTPase A [Verrucomicrobiota bacterium]HOP98198.1 ribosome small subunit-dependent GTPase A [Verrucomicrobiota bacterium]HPU57853.1 ribosome small subunit-dependent GTPase A [Verrucomicrobiota bacterium]